MKIERGLVYALGVAAVTACGGAAGGGTGPTPGGSASLPQVACATGNLVATPQANAAQAALNRTLVVQGDARVPFYTQALQQAQAGIAADAQNPYHFFLAGQAYVGLNNLAEAGQMFDRTLQICPEFASEIDPLREQAWAAELNRGLGLYQGGDTTGAVTAWEAAAQFYSRRPDVFYNLGVVYGQRGDYPRAIQSYRRALAVADSTPGDTAAAILQSEAEMRAASLTGLLSAGAQLFGRDQFRESAEAFRYLTQIDPNNRDAWYNLALALYKLETWSDLVPVARRVVQIDPANYNAQIILFNAYKGLSDQAKAQNNAAAERENRDLALQTLERADALPVQVDGITMTNGDANVTLRGTVTGGSAAQGSPVQLEFTATGTSGDLGTQTVTVAAPAKGATANFEVTIPTQGTATSWRYRIVG